ncbi:protein takeout [Musca domestica]|uniref:Protein takeout n=1 Tax=Musca domestica TaxID=7370 RepID=A0A1I8NJP2_MUSDO|nr:protein takeout [Musca domestica]
MKIIVGLFSITVLIWNLVTLTAAAKVLTEKPGFLTACKRSDPAFGKCFATNLQKCLHEWKSGVPGLKTLGSLDPLHIKRAKFSQGGKNDIISIDMDLANVELMGLSDVIIEDIGSNGNNLDIKFKLTAPNFKWNGDYAMKGNILSLALDSKGKTFMAFEKPTFTLNYKMKLRKEGDYEFADLEKLHLVWEDNANVQFRLENLFNGDKALEDSAHTLLNANWRPIFENLRPVLSQTNEIVLKDILNKIMAYVPANYFFDE